MPALLSRFHFANSPQARAAPDVLLAILVMAVVGLMVVPLPTWLLDLLLAGNLAFSVAMLLLALYVSSALKIAVFPSLLLLTTLLRLALNISSTRLILLNADAGTVIGAFGSFVVRNNYVVGAIIFLILTIVQFVVIARGSERVAEVGARFTLDAMPGKQLAIDADLRAGAITSSEALNRRRQLERESQFYGAMDGAMKFVKGDTMAAFLITLINITAGVAIGVGQRGMQLGEALRRYGLLTIGDGLVAQIPSLIIATSAGMLVTRVVSEGQKAPLGRDLADQVLGQPKAILMAGLFVILLGLVPGLPLLPFLVVGLLLVAVSSLRARRLASSMPSVLRPVEQRDGAIQFTPVLVPWSLELSPDLDELCGDSPSNPFVEAGKNARAKLFSELGVPIPEGLVTRSPRLPNATMVVCLRETPTRRVTLAEPVTRGTAAAAAETLLFEAFSERAHELLGVPETQALLDALEQVAPAAVAQSVPKPISVPLLALVLSRLVRERISVRDLGSVLEALARASSTSLDPVQLAEAARHAQRRAISQRLAKDGRPVPVLVLDSMIEDEIEHSITSTAKGRFVGLPPAVARDISHSIKRAIFAQSLPEDQPKVVLTRPELRPFVRELVEPSLPDVHVISHLDLLDTVKLVPVSTATLGDLED